MAKNYTPEELNAMKPAEFRSIVRKGEWKTVTADACWNFGQANLIALPKEYAFEFLLFCNRNPRPCYVLDVTEAGNPHPMLMAPEADLRTDLPRYRVWKDGEIIEEPYDATPIGGMISLLSLSAAHGDLCGRSKRQRAVPLPG